MQFSSAQMQWLILKYVPTSDLKFVPTSDYASCISLCIAWVASSFLVSRCQFLVSGSQKIFPLHGDTQEEKIRQKSIAV